MSVGKEVDWTCSVARKDPCCLEDITLQRPRHERVPVVQNW